MLRPSHSSSCVHPNNICWGLQITKLLVIPSSLIPCYLVLLRPEYLPRHLILRHPQSNCYDTWHTTSAPKPQILLPPGTFHMRKCSDVRHPRCVCIARSKRDGTRAETRFGLSAKRTSQFKSAGVSVQSTTGSQGVRISGQRLYRPCSDVQSKASGYSLHSHLSPSLPLPCVTVCHQVPNALYNSKELGILILTVKHNYIYL